MTSDRLVKAPVPLLKRNKYVYWAAREARAVAGRFVPPRHYPGIPGRVHFNDFMLEEKSAEGVAAYRARALNVIANIEESLEAGSRTFDGVERWLDFGCGYGRVIRFLVERVDSGKVYASDVITEGVSFCASEFGVRPFYSDSTVSRVRFGSFDFIYSISVLTHLNEENVTGLLRLLGKALAPRAIAMFTTHGRRSIEEIGRYGEEYERMRAEVARSVAERGFAFVPYPYSLRGDYGMTWHSEEYIRRKMRALHDDRLKLLLFKPHGLDDHQDVFAFQRIR
jgi:SAM-dependent methyltransferase